MMERILWPTATSAFFRPSLLAHLRYTAGKIVSLVRAAAHATWTSVDRSHWLPLVVLPLRRLPALWSLPGHIPAQLARWPALGNFDMSVPISATITSAARDPTPGTRRNRAAATAKGAATSAIRAS